MIVFKDLIDITAQGLTPAAISWVLSQNENQKGYWMVRFMNGMKIELYADGTSLILSSEEHRR